MNNHNIGKIRTARVNDRGQLVIPEDIREDLGITGNSTLIIIERQGELLLKTESEVLKVIEDKFWKALSQESLKRAWGKEDEIWDKLSKVQ
ncbi:AbrB/MazE/SpoVT family DNA-binding domain-containing protein [Candidatus Woesearchaeota archaeon]|nr:AbrB/MazE/SpoVT family DNA-binding domain-containing protein [Candidatus Woesearchaeota archaeon]